jgi:protein kinase A
VWLATNKNSLMSTPYALKVFSKYDLISSDEVQSIIREKEILQQLRYHPFIAQLHASFQNDDFLFLVQEFCQGGELFSLMNSTSSNCLPENHASFYALCIADALEFMHVQHHIVYRDLKPENIMLDAKGYPKLIDMGYAKELFADCDYVSSTFCGTPRYVSPEMIASAGSSFGVDHWALGILVNEMLFGYNPFFAEDMDQMELFECICHNEFTPLPGSATNDAINLIAALLAKEPSQRLGRSCTGGTSICKHPWFRFLDLTAMRYCRVPAPWIPSVIEPLDTKCFDDWTNVLDDRFTQDYPKLTRREAAVFDAF